MIAGEGGRKWWLVGCAAVGVVLGVAGWKARPAYQHYKETRALRLAQEFFGKEDYRNGLLSLRQTLALNPDNTAAVTLMADFTAQAQSPAALGWWQRVVALSPTPENKSLLAAVALRLEPPPFPIATAMIDQLAASGKTNVGYHLLASQLALKSNQGDAAEFHLTAATSLEPTNRMHQFNLATLRLQSRHPAVVAAARAELMNLAEDRLWGAPALRALITDALMQTNAATAQQFSQRLLGTTNVLFADRLQAMNAAELAGDAALPELLRQLQADSGTNVLQITQTALWMNGHQRAVNAVIWLSSLDPGLRRVPPLALVAADCQVTARDWAGLELQLTDQKWDEQDFFRLAYLARALREQGRSTTATANWNRAVGATQSRSERVAALVQLALSWGWRDEGIALLWQIVQRPGGEEWPLQNLLRLYIGSNDTAGMLRVHEQLFQRHPDSLICKNNFAMLSLLLGRDVPRATMLAAEVGTAAPTNGIFASTYAYALHLEGQSEAGLKVLQALPERELMRAEVIPYHALLLAACGDKLGARQRAAQAAANTLLPEEKQLLAPLKN